MHYTFIKIFPPMDKDIYSTSMLFNICRIFVSNHLETLSLAFWPLKICFKTEDILAQFLGDALKQKPLRNPKTEKGRRFRVAILVIQNVTLDRVLRKIIEDYGQTDDELTFSIDFLHGKLGKLHCLCQKHKDIFFAKIYLYIAFI